MAGAEKHEHVDIKRVVSELIGLVDSYGYEAINREGVSLLPEILEFVFIRFRALGLGETDAQDLTSNVMIKLLRELKERYGNGKKAKFKSWLHMLRWLNIVIQNEFKNFVKGGWYKRILPFSVFGPGRREGSNSPPEEFVRALTQDAEMFTDRSGMSQRVWALISKEFSDTTRYILMLRFYWGFSYKDIAEIIGKREATVRKIVSRATSKIRSILNVTK